MRVEGSGSSLCLGAHQSFGSRGLESRALWMARRAEWRREGGDDLRGVVRRTGEWGQPSRSTHMVLAPLEPRSPERA